MNSLSSLRGFGLPLSSLCPQQLEKFLAQEGAQLIWIEKKIDCIQNEIKYVLEWKEQNTNIGGDCIAVKREESWGF